MTLKVFGLQNCDTCRKARKWLEAEGMDFEFHDFRKSPVDAETVGEWLAALGPDALVNRRGTTWRGLSDEQKSAQDEALVALIVRHPAIMKRPVFVSGAGVSVGFDEAQREALAAAAP